jgi:Ankyrin repeats (3 copies)
MSGAVTRARQTEQRLKASTRPPETGVCGHLEARPVVEVTKVSDTVLGSTGESGMTPLMRAACEGSAGTVQGLLDRGSDLDAIRSDGFNALTLAAFFGHSQVAWLLLENGADLSATGRSKTLPETWADARGYLDIGTAIREARSTRQVEASSRRTAVIDEPARFPRPAEKESTQNQRPLVTAPPQPALKALPEIQDPPHLAVPGFHPGSAFIARITSSRKSLVALTVAGWLLCCGIGAFLIPRLRQSVAEQPAVSKPASLPVELENSTAGSETSVSGNVETLPTPVAESTPVLKETPEAAPATSATPNSTTALRKGEVTSTTTVSRSMVPARKQRASSRAVEIRQQSEDEEQPKPAPLSIETRSVSGPAIPARANELPGSQGPPLNITSGKPKSKVIQWP